MNTFPKFFKILFLSICIISFISIQNLNASSIFLDTIPEVEEEIFTMIDQSPRFPGCEEIEGSREEKVSCSQKKILEYVYGNLRYPEEARNKKIEGQVVIQFVVEKDGSISDINLVRNLEGGCGEEAVRMVKEMKDMSEKWTPGKQRGQIVRTKYTLPVKFKLEG